MYSMFSVICNSHSLDLSDDMLLTKSPAFDPFSHRLQAPGLTFELRETGYRQTVDSKLIAQLG